MKKNKGFTLIELLVVIAIIGILSSVVLASLNSTRTRARDARRVADIKQIQVALELYFDTNGEYPDTVLALVAPGHIATEPRDPSTAASYPYNNFSD
ncbi:MAG: general secretion pathway protein G, partial [Parcubacteria group bacterium Gr01-1014_72]